MTSTDFAPLAASMRGTVTTPDSDDYDEARAVYNAMIDRQPAAIASCVDTADVITALKFGRDARPRDRRPRRRPPRQRLRRVGRRTHHRSEQHARRRRGARREEGSRPGWRGLGRRRPRDERLRVRRPVRHHQHYRRRRTHTGRRPGQPEPWGRADDRQPRVGGRRPGRRLSRDGKRVVALRPVLGAARRRRQLRHRHELHVPRSRRGEHLRRTNAVRHRRHRRRAAVVPRPAADPAA